MTVYDLYEVKSNIRIFASIDKGTKWRHDLDVAILSILQTFVTPKWHYNAKSVILSMTLQLQRSLESLLIVASGWWVCYSVILLNFWRRSQKTPNCKLWCQFFKFVNLTNIFRAPYENCCLLALQTENETHVISKGCIFSIFHNFLNFPYRPRQNNMIEKTSWWFCDSLNIYISNFLPLPHDSSVRVTSKHQDGKWKFLNRSFFQEDSFRAILAFWWPFFELHEHTPSMRKSK